MDMAKSSEPHPPHGTLSGHLIPGCMFLLWSTWWTLNMMARYLMCLKTKRPFLSRPWFLWKWRGSVLIEPIMKILLASFGILFELRLDNDSWTHLKNQHGHFVAETLNSWQHSVMYCAIILSGCVDLVAHFTGPGQVPEGTEQSFLASAFLVVGILFAFHLKGSDLEQRIHLMLVFIIFMTVIFSYLEIRYPESALLSLARAASVFFQGTWFCEIGHVLFSGDPAWDPTDPAGVMFLPVVFCLHFMLIGAGYLLVFIGLRWCSMKYGSLGLDEGEQHTEAGAQLHELAVLIAKDHV